MQSSIMVQKEDFGSYVLYILLFTPAIVLCVEIDEKLDAEILGAIKTEALKLKIEDFEGDPIFTQSIDVANLITTYHILQLRSNETVEKPTYEREGDDSEQEVIVLQASQKQYKDQTDTKQTGKIFVVFRKIPGGSKNKYYATYAYTRQATQLDQNVVEIGIDQKIFIEWDTWGYRDGRSFESIIDCRSTLIAACEYNTSIHLPYKIYTDSIQEGIRPKSKEILPLQSETGFSLEYSSAFDDLDDNASRARKLGRAVKQQSMTSTHEDRKSGRGLLNLNVLGTGNLKSGGLLNLNILNSVNSMGGGVLNLNILSGGSYDEVDEKRKKTRNMQVMEYYYVITKTKKSKMADGNIKEEKMTEYVPCSKGNCPENKEIYTKVCNQGICEMRLVSQESENNKIFKLIWVNQKRQKDDGSTTEEKIKKYVIFHIFVRTCAECTTFREVSAQEDLSIVQLFTVVKINSQSESSSGKLVDKSVDKYVSLDEETMTNLYKNYCPKTGGKTGGDCTMIRLFDVKDWSSIPTELNGEYTLFISVIKKVKKKSQDDRTDGGMEYHPAPLSSTGPFYAKGCNKAHVCSWEAVTEPNGPTGFYRLLTIRRKTKTSSGIVAEEEILRFEAQPLGSDTKDIYVKFCYPSLYRCVLKPYTKYTEEVSSGTKFFRLVIQIKRIKMPNGEAREESENKYIQVKVYKKQCDDAGICTFEPVTSAYEFRTTNLPIFTLDPESEMSGKKKYVSISPTTRLEIYTQICSATNSQTICGMTPVVEEGQVKQLFRQIEPQKFASALIYRKNCNGNNNQNCSMELLTSFDDRIFMNRSSLYIQVTKASKNHIVHDFELISENDSFFSKYCENPTETKTCGYKNIAADPRNTIYSRTKTPHGKDKFDPIVLYGRLCKDPVSSSCEMVMLTGEASELSTYDTWYVRTQNDPKTGNKKSNDVEEYQVLSPMASEILYKKVCSKNDTCIMKPLMEDKANTYYLLKPKAQPTDPENKGTKPVKNEKEYVPMQIFSRICDPANPDKCDMVPLKQTDDPWKYPLFELHSSVVKTTGKKMKGMEVIQKDYEPILPDSLTAIYRKQCSATDKYKCVFYPLAESEIYKSVTETNPDKPNTQVRKFIQVKFTWQNTDELAYHAINISEELQDNDANENFKFFSLPGWLPPIRELTSIKKIEDLLHNCIREVRSIMFLVQKANLS